MRRSGSGRPAARRRRGGARRPRRGGAGATPTTDLSVRQSRCFSLVLPTMGWPLLSEYLAERDALECEPLLQAAGIERTADLLQLTAQDLAGIGVPVELQYKLFGLAEQAVATEAAEELAAALPPTVIKRRGPAASNELEGFLEKHGVGEAVPVLVELGIERLGDLQSLSAEDVRCLGWRATWRQDDVKTRHEA